MAISSVTNTSALQGINNLNKTSSNLNSIMEKLASGKRINSAKDDAAGVLISDRLSSQLGDYIRPTAMLMTVLPYIRLQRGLLMKQPLHCRECELLQYRLPMEL
nr:hypothetical protein [Succinivibrio dextrinosolvens]